MDSRQKEEGINVFSAFNGMGCIWIALERCGIKVKNKFSSEVDKYANIVNDANYPDTIQLGDIRNVSVNSFKGEKIDLIVGGSPCQGFSFAGKGLNFEDERSKLFFEFVRLLKEVREINTDVKFLLENVKMKKEYQNVISEYLGCDPVELNSKYWSAQNRKRLYWANFEIEKNYQDKGIVLKDILEEGLVCDNQFSQLTNAQKNSFVYTKNYLQYDLSGKGHKSQDQRAFYLTGKHGTLPSHGCESKVKVIENSENEINEINIDENEVAILTSMCDRRIRKLTPIECERLQTVPDNYTNHVSSTQRYKMLGNGWTVDVICHILNGLK